MRGGVLSLVLVLALALAVAGTAVAGERVPTMLERFAKGAAVLNAAADAAGGAQALRGIGMNTVGLRQPWCRASV